MGIFIICDGAMNTYLNKHYLIKNKMENSDLNGNFLQQLGGVENNSFVNIINPNRDNDANVSETDTIKLSSYYDYDKNQFSIFSTNIQSIKAKLDESKLFFEMLNNLTCNSVLYVYRKVG